MEKEVYLPFPKNPSLPKFRQWLKRNFGFAEYPETLDTILDSNYDLSQYATISYHTLYDEYGRSHNVYGQPIGSTEEIYSIVYVIADSTLVMRFEYIPDSHYYAFYKERK